MPLGVSVGVLLLLGPGLVFRTSIPALTDLPGHLLPPTFLADELLPRLRLRGWSMDWFAGFPAYYFYPPLPGLFTAVLSTVTGGPLALRMAMILPVLTLPFALHAFARWSRMGTAQVVGVVVGGSGLLLMGSYWALGGNIRSTLSGQFYYGWSLVLVILYLGLVARSGEGREGGKLAGVVLAAAVLSHVLPALAAGLGTAPFLLSRSHRKAILESWVVGGLLSAFWTVPMAVRLDQVGDAGWAYVPGVGDILPLEVVLLLPAAAAGAWLVRRNPGLALLLSTGLVGVLAAALPQSLIMRGRLLPLWFLALHVLAGVGLAWAWTNLGGRRRAAALSLLMVGGGAALLMVTARGIGPWRDGADAILPGVEARPEHEDLDALVERLRGSPPGRVHWEHGEGLTRWGGTPTLSLIPYWTDHTTLSGLWAESSALYPFVRMADAQLTRTERRGPYEKEAVDLGWDPQAALAKLRMLGVRYLITHTEETGDTVAALTHRSADRFGALRLFDLSEAPLVSTAPCLEPAPPDIAFQEAARAWFHVWTPEEPYLVADGALAQVETGIPGRIAAPTSGEPTAVAVLSVDHDHVRFRTDAVGIPHIVLVSYFPNWKAEGARGPFLVAPWFMMVIPEREVVDLRFGTTPVDRAGWVLTLGGLLGLALAGLRPPKHRRRWASADLSAREEGAP